MLASLPELHAGHDIDVRGFVIAVLLAALAQSAGAQSRQVAPSRAHTRAGSFPECVVHIGALSYPFATGLTASPRGSRIAWAFDRNGVRNIWTADAPDFKARALTNYGADDGQELTNLSVSPDGKLVI